MIYSLCHTKFSVPFFSLTIDALSFNIFCCLCVKEPKLTKFECGVNDCMAEAELNTAVAYS